MLLRNLNEFYHPLTAEVLVFVLLVLRSFNRIIFGVSVATGCLFTYCGVSHDDDRIMIMPVENFR